MQGYKAPPAFEGAGWQSCAGCAQQQADATAASIKTRFM
jgi:hypothetical protein